MIFTCHEYDPCVAYNVCISFVCGHFQIKRRAAEKLPLAVVPVDLGGDAPKLNLTLLEGYDLKDTGAVML